MNPRAPEIILGNMQDPFVVMIKAAYGSQRSVYLRIRQAKGYKVSRECPVSIALRKRPQLLVTRTSRPGINPGADISPRNWQQVRQLNLAETGLVFPASPGLDLSVLQKMQGLKDMAPGSRTDAAQDGPATHPPCAPLEIDPGLLTSAPG